MPVETFMTDPRLVTLCEYQRIGDEVLDVISLHENQHSDILAWLLDSKEGHGQGDGIIRDLLISASTAAQEQQELSKKCETAKFFKKWPASRIQTTSFGAAFTARELGLKAAERVDLFVVDAQNRFILVIENKKRGGHKITQLGLYREKFNELVASNARLQKYDYAFVALDREFDVDLDSDATLADAGTWLHLGYEWLKTSASRAVMHVARGNAAAKLVVSYCNRQTDWEHPANQKAIDIALELHQSHPEAIKTLLELSGGRLERAWLNTHSEDAAFLFLLQNKGVVALLKETRGMAVVQAAILKALPTLSRDSIEHGRVSLSLCPRGWERFAEDGFWPVYLSVKDVGESESVYTLALCWNANHIANDETAKDLRGRLGTVDGRFRQHAESKWRRVVLARRVSLQDIVKAAIATESRLVESLG